MSGISEKVSGDEAHKLRERLMRMIINNNKKENEQDERKQLEKK